MAYLKEDLDRLRASFVKAYQLEIFSAKTKCDGFLWLLEHGIDIGKHSVIFDNYGNKFSLKPYGLTEEEINDLVVLLNKSPFQYVIYRE